MELHAEINYPTGTPEQVFAMTVDPEFWEAVCRATSALSYDIDIDSRDDGSATITILRTMPADVPDYVKKFLGATVDVVQTETWGPPDAAGQRDGRLVVSIKGQPATMTATMTTRSVDAGAQTTIRGDLKVSIPFVGKKIEPEIAKGVLAAIDKEQQTADTWLGEPA